MEPVKGYNIYKTGYSAEKLMAYFEKNGMLEIIQKLFLETIYERPVDVRKFIAENIRRIAAEIQSTKTVLLLPPVFDTKDLVKTFATLYNIPTVVYKRERKPGDIKKIFEKYQKFLRHFKWERRHQIFINFPRNCKEILDLKETDFKPNTVVEVRHGFQVPFKSRHMLQKEGASFIKEFKQVEDFYNEAFRTVHFMSREECFEDSDRLYQTVGEICSKLVSVMRNTNSKRLDHANGRFCPRVVFFGRRGSGRKTQAIALAKRYELVYINAQELVAEYLASPCGLGEFLRDGMKKNEHISTVAVASVVYKRILQKDSVMNGWVIVGFPYNLEGFQCMDKFITTPNKIIVLHCRERVALRRIVKREDYYQRCNCVKLNCCKPLEKFSMEYIKKEMGFYTLNKESILDFLATKKETIHVDGNHSFLTVKTNIWLRIDQVQHKIGMTFPPD